MKNKKNNSGPADGIIYATVTKNNTLLTLTEPNGDVMTWTSCRNCGFFGSQKSSQLAIITASEEIGLRAIDFQLKKVNLLFRGRAKGRQSVLRGLTRSGVSVHQLIIVPTVPYNGCRLEKKSRK